ncbi:MAG: hypothetical protein JXA46_00060 [Dehalococcoidales bacterium]|nr:hypothetical protein [Dehalococcoidales bacterium]
MIKEVLYFDTPERRNTDEILSISIRRAEELRIHHAVIAWSSGYTAMKFLEMSRNLQNKINLTVVTNAKGAIMPFIISQADNAETRKWKEEQISKGILGTFISITDETRRELEKEGVKVYYVPDYLNVGEPLALRNEQAARRAKLAPFGVAEHLRPLDIDAGVDLSLLTVISQGFRVCFGCTLLAVKNGLIPEGELVLTIAGKATALIILSGPEAKTCLVKEILGFERGSSWTERDTSKTGVNLLA